MTTEISPQTAEVMAIRSRSGTKRRLWEIFTASIPDLILRAATFTRARNRYKEAGCVKIPHAWFREELPGDTARLEKRKGQDLDDYGRVRGRDA